MFQSEFISAIERDQNNSIPVSTYQVDDLMEKLKFLNYEKLLLKEMKMKPPGRLYFLQSYNPGEQFYLFTSICAWLIRKLGKSFNQPQEFDDPSTTIANIIKVLQDLDIPTDFPSNKLIQGAGPICVFILDCLATQALKVAKVQFHRPEIKPEEESTVEIMENDSEIILEKVEEEQMAIGSDDSDNEGNSLMNLNIGSASHKTRQSHHFDLKEYKSENMTATENWRLELERVLPQLKIVVKTDPRDWRAHLEQMKTLKNNIDLASDETQNQLKKLQTDISFVMEKIDSREKNLNNELKDLIQQYKMISLELSQVNNAIKEIDMEKAEKEREFANIVNEMETVKMQMEQRGNSMTDGSPLINIKKAIVKIKEETVQMDLKIGVLDHSLTHEILRHNAQITEMNPMTTLL